MTTQTLPAPATTACTLCGASLPTRPIEGEAGERFCCHGCAHVAAIVSAVGESSETARRALAVARQRGLISRIDDETEEDSAVDLPEEARCDERLRVAGLACPSCGWLVEAVVAGVDGVTRARVDYLTDTAQVVFDLRRTSREKIAQAVEEAGYGLASLDVPVGAHERREWIRLVVAGVVAMNLMGLAFVGYDTFLRGAAAGAWETAIAWLQLAAAVPVVTWCALPIYRRAWAAIRLGRVVMETLLSLGILGATGLSTVAVATAQPHMYLETATVLVALSLGGRALERSFKRRAAHSLLDLLQFAPTKARRASDGRFAPLAEISEGELVRVEAGEDVPLDLRLAEDAVVREALLTGEPHPVLRHEGEVVLAGSAVEGEALVGAVARTVGHSVADSMRSRVEEALRRADQGSRIADRLAQGFVPLVVLVAGAAFAGHLIQGAALSQAVLVAVSVLVVACPCAFGVAASLALSLAVLRLARIGVLVKEPAALESLRATDTVLFDKTGTLTRGDLSLVEIGWSGEKSPELMSAVQALERGSRHPIGLALTRLLPSAREVVADGIVEVPGMGITGTVDGRRIAVGRAGLFAQFEEASPPDAATTRVWFGVAGEVPAGHIDLADTLRPEAAEVIQLLGERGMSSELLSGDADPTTKAIAERAGIGVAQGGLLPQAKAEHVGALRAAGRHVAFVGDGFNDAEALAAAEVGVAVASGADLAMLSAPVVITRSDLRAVIDLVDVARRSVRVLRGNFVWAFAYNVALVPVAALGWLAPIHAAALMALSSVSVALNSLRVRSGPALGGV